MSKLLSKANRAWCQYASIFALAIALFLTAYNVANAGWFTTMCSGLGPSCPAGYNAADGDVCLTCVVSGVARGCVDGWGGCGGGHVCNGTCTTLPGGTKCTVTMNSPC
jgi:hypothetical protein